MVSGRSVQLGGKPSLSSLVRVIWFFVVMGLESTPALRNGQNFRRVQHRPDLVRKSPDPLFRLGATSVANRLRQAINPCQRMFGCRQVFTNIAKTLASDHQVSDLFCRSRKPSNRGLLCRVHVSIAPGTPGIVSDFIRRIGGKGR